MSLIMFFGPFTNYIDKEEGWGLAKCQRHYISLCSKFVDEGEEGIRNPQNPDNVVCDTLLFRKTV